MTTLLQRVLAIAESWTEAEQDELAQVGLAIEARRHGAYEATPEELLMIDEAVAAVERGEVATDEEVEAVFAKYRQT